MRVAGFALAALLLPAAAPAQRLTGELLVEHCQARLAGRTGFESGLCLGAIAGALEAHDTLLPKDEHLYCLGNRSISNDHAVRIVLGWLREHPEYRARPASTAIVFALRDAFPCAAPAADAAASR